MENLVQIALQNVNLAAIMPSLVLVCFGMGLLLINVFLPRGTTRPAVWISLVALGVTAGVTLSSWGSPQYGFSDAVALDNFATFFNVTFLIAAALTILRITSYNVCYTKLLRNHPHSFINLHGIGLLMNRWIHNNRKGSAVNIRKHEAL